MASELDQIGEADALEPGRLPSSWLGPRSIAPAILKGEYADIQHHDWVAFLHDALAATLGDWGIEELDGSTLRSTATRAVTQAASRAVSEASLAGADVTPLFAGVGYESRFGNDIQCWAVFEYAGQVEAPFTRLASISYG